MDITKYSKAQLVKFGKTKCHHGHTFLAHPGCIQEKELLIGFLDIETSNLDADFGIILSYCISPLMACLLLRG
jgi:hypothetical protein